MPKNESPTPPVESNLKDLAKNFSFNGNGFDCITELPASTNIEASYDSLFKTWIYRPVLMAGFQGRKQTQRGPKALNFKEAHKALLKLTASTAE